MFASRRALYRRVSGYAHQAGVNTFLCGIAFRLLKQQVAAAVRALNSFEVMSCYKHLKLAWLHLVVTAVWYWSLLSLYSSV